jgi:hypothetical protein
MTVSRVGVAVGALAPVPIFVDDLRFKNHYEVYKNKKDYENGQRDRSVWEDGRLKEKF